MTTRKPITTHVLDTAHGQGAAGVQVTLEFRAEFREEHRAEGPADARWSKIATAVTDAQGRIENFEGLSMTAAEGVYRLTFAIEEYWRRKGTEAFFPEVAVVFNLTAARQHYHVPLLMSPFGYSTYRGT